MFGGRRDLWMLDPGIRPMGAVQAGNFAPPSILIAKGLELHPQDCCVQLVEARVHAGGFTDIPLPPSILLYQPTTVGEFRIGGHDSAAVAHRPQVLGGIDAESSGQSNRADLTLTVHRAVRLR